MTAFSHSGATTGATARATATTAVRADAGAIALAALRITTGFVFLRAFFDKLFGLGYATKSANAWINGGSPTEGFLSRVAVGPFESTSTPGPVPGGPTGCSCSACTPSASRSWQESACAWPPSPEP